MFTNTIPKLSNTVQKKKTEADNNMIKKMVSGGLCGLMVPWNNVFKNNVLAEMVGYTGLSGNMGIS